MELDKPRYAYIDALRGYAILLVITCDITFSYSYLPYPVRRLAILGWHGVQLFFLISCLALMLSWRAEVAQRGRADIGAFFLRRAFRIMPAYYLGGLLYWQIAPPAHGFDLAQFITAYGFVNLWHPLTAPTVMGQWSVIPGGWSISVLFTFYALFPFIAGAVTSLRRAIFFTLGAIALAIFANRIGFLLWHQTYSTRAVEDILYFWFPNQLPGFAFGTVIFFLLEGGVMRLPGRWADGMAAGALMLFFALSWSPFPQWAGENAWTLGMAQAAALPLGGFVLALARARPGIFINPLAAWVGKISFSAYLLHYAAIDLLLKRYPQLFHTHATGFTAIAAYAAGWLAVTGATCLGAFCTYHVIEQPIIDIGKRLTTWRRRQ